MEEVASLAAAFAPRPAAPLLLLLALALDWLTGEPLGRVHPVALAGRLIAALECRLNRPERGERTRRARGVLLVLVVTGLAAGVGGAMAWFARALAWGWLVELAFVATLLAQRSMFDHARRVGRALERDGLDAARRAVGAIVGRDTQGLDGHGVARAAIESTAENFADGVVAPAFWYLLLGPAGIAAYKAINTLDSMVGYRDARFRAFGWCAARLDDVANWLPARLAALLLILGAAFTPTAAPWRALVTVLRDSARHASPNAGWPEAAMAGALGLALNGPRAYGGAAGDQPWIGQGRARATAADIRRALFLYAVACALVAAPAGAIALAWPT
ncbi:MAG: cobalamin biosynthesis protein CobD [Alphaproteobacteria bacterium]|nr:cobalamin biosynthesis protein CobD [Alphaproteobacteria bacterium]